MKKNLMGLLLLTGVLFAGFTSCSDDDKKLKLCMNEAQITIDDNTELVVIESSDGDCTVKVDNEQVLTFEYEIKENGTRIIKLFPQALGKATLTVTDAGNNVAQVAVTVVEPFMPFFVRNSEMEIKVEDATVKATIEADLKKETPQTDNVLALIKNEKAPSYLYATYDDVLAGKPAQSIGVYRFEKINEKPHLLLQQVESKEHKHHIVGRRNNDMNVLFAMFKPEWNELNPTRESNYIPVIEMEADLTATYAAKYPNAKVESVVIKTTMEILRYRNFPFPTK